MKGSKGDSKGNSRDKVKATIAERSKKVIIQIGKYKYNGKWALTKMDKKKNPKEQITK